MRPFAAVALLPVLVVLLPCDAGGQTPVADPLTLFAKMMPVLSHDRCVNCHGATDPFTGDFHPGEVSQDTPCHSCHTTAANWRLAPSQLAFFHKTTRQLCDHFERETNRDTPAAMIYHLENDPLIGEAFIGRRGGAVPPQFTRTPPMSRAAFVAAYRAWVTDGGGTCSRWEGTITRTETVADAIIDTATAGPSLTTASQIGTHSYSITIRNGTVTVTTTLSGETNHKVVVTSGGCVSTDHSSVSYSLVNAVPSPQRAAARADTEPLIATGNGEVHLGLAPNGSYRIHVVPPSEQTKTVETSTTTTNCPIPFSTPSPTTLTHDWKPWMFDIVGTLANPRDRTHIRGDTTIVVDSSYEPAFGLAASAYIAHQDGSPVKFKITTTWDLSRVP